MITLITGKPGGGKSYCAIQEFLIPDIEAGCIVTTNFPLIDDWWLKKYPDLVIWDDPAKAPSSCARGIYIIRGQDPDSIRRVYETAPEGSEDRPSKIYIDEGSEVADNYDPATKKVMRDFLSFLRLHRHYDTDIYIVTQHTGMLQKRVGYVAQRYLVCADMRIERIPGLLGGATLPWLWHTFRMAETYMGKIYLDHKYIHKDFTGVGRSYDTKSKKHSTLRMGSRIQGVNAIQQKRKESNVVKVAIIALIVGLLSLTLQLRIQGRMNVMKRDLIKAISARTNQPLPKVELQNDAQEPTQENGETPNPLESMEPSRIIWGSKSEGAWCDGTWYDRGDLTPWGYLSAPTKRGAMFIRGRAITIYDDRPELAKVEQNNNLFDKGKKHDNLDAP